MRAAALQYTAACAEWSQNVGFFFHVFGHNSVNALHLHIIDLDYTGPTFKMYRYKNCPLDCIIKVLKEEVACLPRAPVSELEIAAKKAAAEAVLGEQLKKLGSLDALTARVDEDDAVSMESSTELIK